MSFASSTGSDRSAGSSSAASRSRRSAAVFYLVTSAGPASYVPAFTNLTPAPGRRRAGRPRLGQDPVQARRHERHRARARPRSVNDGPRRDRQERARGERPARRLPAARQARHVVDRLPGERRDEARARGRAREPDPEHLGRLGRDGQPRDAAGDAVPRRPEAADRLGAADPERRRLRRRGRARRAASRRERRHRADARERRDHRPGGRSLISSSDGGIGDAAASKLATESSYSRQLESGAQQIVDQMLGAGAGLVSSTRASTSTRRREKKVTYGKTGVPLQPVDREGEA